jgi:polysaccharide chain length determinant protein (PEP-CTERM system associated)
MVSGEEHGVGQTPALGNYVAILRRRSMYVATILPAVLFVCVVAAFGIRPLYQSSAVIMLEPSSVPKDIIESTVLSYSDQQIEIVQGRVMTIEGLQRIVREIDPYPDRVAWTPAEKAQHLLEDTSLEKVDPVTMKPQAESNAFSLHYDNPNPAIAVAIDERLAQLFLTYNQIRRTEAAGEAAGFLKKQSDQVAEQMRQIDAEVAALKNKYGEALPEFLQRNQSTVEDLQRQLDSLQQQILTAQEKESVLSVQLSQTSPNLITQSGDLTDIATVRAKLTEAEQRYTPEHPEVKRLRRALQTLMAQQSGGTSPGGIAQQSNNPQYQMTATQLQAARDELNNLKAQANAMRAKLEQYRGLVARTPGAEREVSEVLRRREVLQVEYQHAQDRLQSANLAETFESHQGGERFTMLRAPILPRSPVFPNRVGLILLGLVFGAALTGIAVAIAESNDKNVRTTRIRPLLNQVPVLATIPYIKNTRDKRRHALMLSSFAVAYSLAAVIAIAVVISTRHR